jgi:hypothetical protein
MSKRIRRDGCGSRRCRAGPGTARVAEHSAEPGTAIDGAATITNTAGARETQPVA